MSETVKHTVSDTDHPVPANDGASKARLYEIGRQSRKLAKQIGYRLFRLSGEFIAIILGIGLIWFAGLNVLLAKRTVDITFLKDNAALWFAEAFDGNDADIGHMTVEWSGAENALQFRAQDIVIKDKSGAEMQRINAFSCDVGIQKALSGDLDARHLTIDGGSVTYFKRANGSVIAGLGTPDTVGKLGPVWTGAQASNQSRAFSMGGLASLRVSNADGYLVDEQDNLKLRLANTFITVDNMGEHFDVTGSTELRSGESVSPIEGELSLTPDYQDFDLSLNAVNLNLKQLSPETGRWAALGALDAPADIQARIVAKRETGLDIVDLVVTSAGGKLDLGPVSQNFQQANAKARYDKDDQVLIFTDVALKSDRLVLNGTASFADVGTPATGFFMKPGKFKFDLDKLDIDATPFFPQPYSFERVEIGGIWERTQRHLQLSQIDLDFGGFATDFTGETKRNEAGKWSLVKLGGRIDGVMSPDDLLSLWPSQLALGARDFIKRAIISADISDLNLNVNLPKSVLASGQVNNEDLSLDFRVDKAHVKYISTMSPLLGASGRGRLQGNQFEITADSGRVENIMVDEGKVVIPRLWPKGGDFTIDVKANGPVTDLLMLIDQKPFGYLNAYGVTPEQFSGQGDVELSITRPLLENFDQSRIRYSVKGALTGVKAPFSVGAHQVQQGNVNLIADRDGLQVTGPIMIGKWPANLEWREIFDLGATPSKYKVTGVLGRDDLDDFGIGFRQYFDGDIALTVDAEANGLELLGADIKADLARSDLQITPYWNKPKGAQGQFTGKLSRTADGAMTLKDMALTAPGLSMMGDIDLASNMRLINFDLSQAKIDNFIDAQIRAKPDEADEKFDVYITGDFMDVSPLVTSSLQTQSNAMDVPILLTANLKTLRLGADYNLKDANVLFAHDGVGIRQLRVKGDTSDGDFIAQMTADDKADLRTIRVDIPNASDAALAFMKLDNIAGGRLQIDATLPSTGNEGALRGDLRVEDFTLVRAPILAQMLSMASLRGLGDVLGGSGLKFRDFDVPFSLEKGTLSIRDAKASGSALGITGEGDIKFDSKLLDFDGVIVPAYTANSMLGSVPVIGDILVGKKGEGIFALSYTVKGSFDQTQIAINPLSALTPGFLRNIFKPSRKDLPEGLKEEILEVAPKPRGKPK